MNHVMELIDNRVLELISENSKDTPARMEELINLKKILVEEEINEKKN